MATLVLLAIFVRPIIDKISEMIKYMMEENPVVAGLGAAAIVVIGLAILIPTLAIRSK